MCSSDLAWAVAGADMIAAGYSPSVRLFEAAACAVPLISDVWEGLGSFFEPGAEILLAESAEAVLAALDHLPEEQRSALGRAGRARIMARHTAAHRADELETLLAEAGAMKAAASLMRTADLRPA